MSKILLNLYFSSNLLFDAGFHDLGFVKTLERDDVVWLAFGADHVNTTEFSLTEGTTNVEVMKFPFTGRTYSASASEKGMVGMDNNYLH